MATKLEKFSIEIHTGKKGMDHPVTFSFNNHRLHFLNTSGQTAQECVFRGEFSPSSVVHTLVLEGPPEGEWDISKMKLEFHCQDEEPYTIQYGAITLNDANEVNLWKKRPLPVFDV